LTGADGNDVNGSGVGGLLALIGGGWVGGLFPAGADGIKPRLDNIPFLAKGIFAFADADEPSLACTEGIPGAAVGIDCCGILSAAGCGGGTICCCIPGTGGAEGAIGPAYCSALVGIGGIEGAGAAGPAY